VRYYHRTSSVNAERIVVDGFIDAESIASDGNLFRGVWITEYADAGNIDDVLLAIDVDDPNHRARIDIFEWQDESEPYRKWLVPAKLLNLVGTTSVVEERYREPPVPPVRAALS
jgi:hypothetical protein